MHIEVKRLAHGADLPLPRYQSADAAGMDLLAAVGDAPVTLHPLDRALIPTGLSIALPRGYEGQVRPRSGLALKSGLTVLNAPGTIDADYRGEVGVILVNLSAEPIHIKHGDRIAQLVIAPVTQGEWREVEVLESSVRGAGGFGSTGV